MLLLAGVVAGLALDWFFFGIALKRMNPLVQIYSPDRLVSVSHFLYGIALASYPSFARELSPAAEPSPSGPDVTNSDQEVGRSIP